MFLSTGRMYGTSHVPVWTTITALVAAGDSGGWSGYTQRFVTAAFDAGVGGTKIRVTLQASTAQGFTIDGCYVQLKAATYDYTTTPVQILFSGAAGVTVGTNSSVLSDEISFTCPSGTQTLVIGSHFSAASSDRTFTGGGTVHYRAATSQAATVSPVGVFTSTIAQLISKIELLI